MAMSTSKAVLAAILTFTSAAELPSWTPEWPLPEQYACGICVNTRLTVPESEGSVARACDTLYGSTGRTEWCQRAFASMKHAAEVDHQTAEIECGSLGFCEVDTAALLRTSMFLAQEDPEYVDIRVSKAFGTKSYDLVRLSLITQSQKIPPTTGFEFDYSDKFKYKWTDNTLSSSMVSIPAGGQQFKIGNTTVSINVPKQGEGVAGVLIADPCISSSSITSLISCGAGRKFDTETRTPKLLNLFVGDNQTSFWSVLGDNWYDRVGDTTKAVYKQISLETKSKIFFTVGGNHDYWITAPQLATRFDQFGNGHFQWYTQDTKAAEHLMPGSKGAPFNYSVDPEDGTWVLGGHLPAIDNGFFYNQIGNLGVIGFSGAYSYEETLPLLKEACAWAKTEKSIQVLLLAGHWDTGELGCEDKMDVPTLYDNIKKLDGCDAFEAKKNLKFVMGHTHCNVVHPHGRTGAGFMVAGQGMDGCNNYGIPIIDTTEGRLRMHYFSIVAKNGTDTYDSVASCVEDKGWRNCLHLAETWLDQAI